MGGVKRRSWRGLRGQEGWIWVWVKILFRYGSGFGNLLITVTVIGDLIVDIPPGVPTDRRSKIGLPVSVFVMHVTGPPDVGFGPDATQVDAARGWDRRWRHAAEMYRYLTS